MTRVCVRRGFHVYKDVWRPVIGEELRCQREEDNPRDPYAVAVTKSCTGVGGVEVVGHVPRSKYGSRRYLVDPLRL